MQTSSQCQSEIHVENCVHGKQHVEDASMQLTGVELHYWDVGFARSLIVADLCIPFHSRRCHKHYRRARHPETLDPPLDLCSNDIGI